MLGRYVFCGVSCMRCVRHHVTMLSIMSLLPSYIHTHTKKKMHLLCEACCRDKMGDSLHMVLEWVQPATWDRYGFR